jgi:hypothetical protein
MLQIATEKSLEKSKHEEAENIIQRLKHSMRASSSHHEVNTKRLREKLSQVENEL